jgi:secretion/DNA translocation related TadE-like protein
VLVLAMAGLLCFVALALAAGGGLVRAQRSAQAAADLAALAAAGGSTAAGGGGGCGEAAVIATANGAVLTSCEMSGMEARVVVQVPGPAWVRRVDVTAEARAGPA